MATEKLTIEFEERGSRTISRAIRDISRTADRATKDLFLLVRAFRAVRDAAILLGGFGAVSAFIGQLDKITTFENRFRLVTSSVAELNTVFNELTEVAIRSRSSFESVAELYSRTALSARDLGISQREVIQFTESLGKAAILSGASVREASAALIQLSQGISSNRLSGDELRSLLEQLPFAADIIAKSLGVGRGELKKLGTEGKLTGEVVIKAFKDARGSIDALFEKTAVTVSQALNVLGVKFLQFFRQFDDAVGLTETLSKAILTLASNFDVLSGSIEALVAASLVFLTLRYVTTIATLITLIKSLAGAFLTLGKTILFSPLSVIASVLTAAFVAAKTFGNEIAIVEGKINTYGDAAQAAFEIAFEAVSDFATRTIDSLDGISVLGRRVFRNLGIPRTFEEFKDSARDWANTTIGLFIGVSKVLPKVLEVLPEAVGEVFVAVSNTVQKKIVDMINGFIALVESGLKSVLDPVANFLIENTGFLPGDGSIAESINSFGESVKEFATLDRVSFEPSTEFEGAGRKLADIIKESFTDELFKRDFIGEAITEVLRRSDAIALDREIRRVLDGADLDKKGNKRKTTTDTEDGGRSKKTFKDFLREILGQNEALKVNSTLREKLLRVVSVEKSLRRELTAEERNLFLGLIDINQSLERQSDIFDSLRNPQKEYGTLIQDLTSLLTTGKISVDEFNEKLREGRIKVLELDETPLGGLERGFFQVTEAALNFSKFTEDAVVNVFGKLEDTIADFVTTGKLNFRSFVTDVSAMLVKLATNQALQFLFNAVGSTLFSSFVPRTSGGSATGLGPVAAADGGLFEVSSRIGSPRAGRDNRFVPMFLRDGETVEVTPRGQSPRRGGTVINMTVYANDAGSFKASQDQIAADMGRRLNRAQRNE